MAFIVDLHCIERGVEVAPFRRIQKLGGSGMAYGVVWVGQKAMSLSDTETVSEEGDSASTTNQCRTIRSYLRYRCGERW